MYAVNMRGDLLDEHKTEREREDGAFNIRH